MRLRRKYADRGLRLVLVSADFDDSRQAALDFLGRREGFPNLREGRNDSEFIEALDSRWSGALPASFLYDGQGVLRDFWEGQGSYSEMNRRIRAVLASDGERQRRQP